MVLAIPLCLTGLVLMYFDRTRLILALRSYAWKPTRAVVTDLQNVSFDLDAVTSRGPQVISYREFSYCFQYHVHGVEHHTQNYCFGGHMDQASANYHVGDETTLYVDPRNPEQAVVRRGMGNHAQPARSTWIRAGRRDRLHPRPQLAGRQGSCIPSSKDGFSWPQ